MKIAGNMSFLTIKTPYIIKKVSILPLFHPLNSKDNKKESILSKGKGRSPMDFSQKNWMALSAQLALLKRIIFPEEFTPEEQFDLSQEDLPFCAIG